jgi:hypothetical protein
MTPESVVVSSVMTIIVINILLSYVHVFVDDNVTFERIGFTISAVSDSPERQLVALLMVALLSYVVTSMMYATQRTRQSPVISALGLGTCMLLFGTLLTRLSINSTAHYTLAACTFMGLLMLMVAMTNEIFARGQTSALSRYFCVAMTLGLVALYLLLIFAKFAWRPFWNAQSSRLLAAVELVTILTFTVVLMEYFN